MKQPFEELLPKFHDVSPYDGFDAAAYEEDIQGWGSYSPVFETIIKRVEPSIIVEVGTWKGASAIHMSNLLKQEGIDCAILCVDTWLGDSSHWYRPEWRSHLQIKNGYPSFYYQFLANVVKHGHDDMIIPVPQTSRSACDWLKHEGIEPDLAYIDCSGDPNIVYLDIQGYWERLAPNGVLFGDDYGGVSDPGVTMAVDKFGQDLGREPMIIENKWIFTKNA